MNYHVQAALFCFEVFELMFFVCIFIVGVVVGQQCALFV